MLLPSHSSRAAATTLLFACCIGCAGKSVVDQSGGGGAAGASSSSTGSSSTGSSSASSTSASSSGSTSTSASGAGGSPGWDCGSMEAEYLKQLELARICAPQVSALQCTLLVDDKLPCPCPTFVNPANAASVDQLQYLSAAWNAHGCGDAMDCPAMPCPVPSGAFCEPQPPGSMAPGLCKDGF